MPVSDVATHRVSRGPTYLERSAEDAELHERHRAPLTVLRKNSIGGLERKWLGGGRGRDGVE